MTPRTFGSLECECLPPPPPPPEGRLYEGGVINPFQVALIALPHSQDMAVLFGDAYIAIIQLSASAKIKSREKYKF